VKLKNYCVTSVFFWCLDSLPVLDTPDEIVVRAFAALIGELLYIANNTVPQLSYSMSSLTRYMSKAKCTDTSHPTLMWCCVILLASRKDSSRGVPTDRCFKHHRSRAHGTGQLQLWHRMEACSGAWISATKSTDVYKDNTGCIALVTTCTFVVAVSTLLCEYALFINGLINVKQCPTAAQTADIGTKALPRVLFENFTAQTVADFLSVFLGWRILNFITGLRLNVNTLCFLVPTSFSIVNHF